MSAVERISLLSIVGVAISGLECVTTSWWFGGELRRASGMLVEKNDV